MFESDADRLALIRSLGGVVFVTAMGEFHGILDEGYADAQVGEIDVEGTAPFVTCRQSDVDRLKLSKGMVIQHGSRALKVQRPEPDGTGMCRLVVTG